MATQPDVLNDDYLNQLRIKRLQQMMTSPDISAPTPLQPQSELKPIEPMIQQQPPVQIPPRDTVSEFRQGAENIPQRDPVSRGRKIGSILAGIGTGLATMSPFPGIAMGKSIYNAPYHHKMQDWETKQEELGKVAKLETEKAKTDAEVAEKGFQGQYYGAEAERAKAQTDLAHAQADLANRRVLPYVPTTKDEYIETKRAAQKPPAAKVVQLDIEDEKGGVGKIQGKRVTSWDDEAKDWVETYTDLYGNPIKAKVFGVHEESKVSPPGKSPYTDTLADFVAHNGRLPQTEDERAKVILLSKGKNNKQQITEQERRELDNELTRVEIPEHKLRSVKLQQDIATAGGEIGGVPGPSIDSVVQPSASQPTHPSSTPTLGSALGGAKATVASSPEKVEFYVDQAHQSPSQYAEKGALPKGIDTLVRQRYTEKYGLPFPAKLRPFAQDMEVKSNTSLNNVNSVLETLAKNRDLKRYIGPILGRYGKFAKVIGGDPIPGVPDNLQEKAQYLGGLINYSLVHEATVAGSGKTGKYLIDTVKEWSAGTQLTMPRLKGALESIQRNANDQLDSVYMERYPGNKRPAPQMEMNRKDLTVATDADLAKHGVKQQTIKTLGGFVHPRYYKDAQGNIKDLGEE